MCNFIGSGLTINQTVAKKSRGQVLEAFHQGKATDLLWVLPASTAERLHIEVHRPWGVAESRSPTD